MIYARIAEIIFLAIAALCCFTLRFSLPNSIFLAILKVIICQNPTILKGLSRTRLDMLKVVSIRVSKAIIVAIWNIMSINFVILHTEKE